MSQGWLVEGLGMVAATLTTGGMMPQAIRVWRRKSASDLSLAMYLMIWTGTILWLAYALIVGSISLLYANGAALLLASLILYFKLRFD
jgi:MtN3 and saliva related transmembrane protein